MLRSIARIIHIVVLATFMMGGVALDVLIVVY